jgi:NAD(P)-dependent dehydrogenase (short-subunit alcohol dehydrogenase family)
VLITGAGSGIGRELALALAQEGAAVAAVDKNEAALKALVGALADRRLATATADVTDFSSLHRAVWELTAQLGPIDLLIASAGVGIETSALDFRAADFEAVVRVNLIGVARSVAAVLPEMLARGRGHVAALSSVASFRGFPRLAGYCASKAGVNVLLDAVRVEAGPRGVAVTTICPGWVRTPMTADLGLDPKEVLEAPEAARRIVAALRAGRPYVAFPAGMAWWGRLLSWLPCRASDWLTRRAVRAAEQRAARAEALQ